MHAVRIAMTKRPDKIVLDYTGTSRRPRPDQLADLTPKANLRANGWVPVLRSLADTPERAAEIDMNEGVLDVIELKFPPKGTLVTPHFGKATGLRFFPLLRSLGISPGCWPRRPTDACRRTTRPSASGVFTRHHRRGFLLFREVLGGGGPGRPWADGSDVVHVVPNSRNLPAEFSETRYPVIVEKLGLATDSGGAGYRRGGSATTSA